MLWDTVFAVLALAAFVGVGVWIWRKSADLSPAKAIGHWAFLWAFVCGAQLAARGLTERWAWIALASWLGLVALSATIVGIRHLLTRRDSRQIAG